MQEPYLVNRAGKYFTTMNLCIICLRTGKLRKLANSTHKDFYEEVCDLGVINMTYSYYYCTECEYLLAKFYKFKEKCVKALRIYENWMSENPDKRQPMNQLHKFIPSSLGMWTASKRIANFTIQAADVQKNAFIELVNTRKELVKDKFKQVKVEYDLNDSNDSIEIIKNEQISKNAPKSVHKYIKDVENDFIEDIGNDSEKEEIQFFENLDKLLETKTKDGSNLNVKRESEVSDLVTNFLTKKKPSKRITPNKKTKVEQAKKVKKDPVKKEIKEKPKGKKTSRKMRAIFEKTKENNKIYESVFDIEYLDTRELKVEEFKKRKTYECYVKAQHKCEICFQIFKSLKFLKYHTEKYHTESPGSVLCAICKTWHAKTGNHTSTHSVVYKCRQCPLVTYHRESMQKHFQWHNGKLYRCEECNLSYKSTSVYRAHMGRVHRVGRHVCAACGRGFRSPLGLKIHVNSSMRCTAPPHTAQGVRCDECDVTLPSREIYDAHIFDVHEAPRRHGRPNTKNSAGLPAPSTSRTSLNYTRGYRVRKFRPARHTCRVVSMSRCHFVGKPLTQGRMMETAECGKHNASQLGCHWERSVPSSGRLSADKEKCNQICISWFKLQQHFKAEHPNDDMTLLYADKAKHLCDICGNGFSNMYALRDHMNIHTGARPYPCDLCPKRFRSTILLREHRVRHFPSTVSCPHCSRLFKSKGNLCSHMKIHTGEKDHKCDICGKEFLHKVNLKEHIRGVHYNIRRVKRGTREGVSETGLDPGRTNGATTAGSE